VILDEKEEKMWKKLVLVVPFVLLIVALLIACGATPEPQVVVRERAVAETVVVVEVEKEAAMMPTAAPEATAAAGSLGLASLPAARVERMIIKNAEMDLLVADTDVALDSITVIAADYGGYIVSSHTWFEGEFKYATVRLGVPVAEFENILRRLRGLALKVNSEVASGEDVTDQYVDLQSRLTNLEATQARIREFLDKAANVEEALKVNEQLSQVEAQIEEIQGRMNYLKDRSAFSTIDVQLSPERPTPTPTPTSTPTPTPTPAVWRPGETVKDASGVLTAILKGLVELAIWILVVLGPFLIPVALVIWLVVWSRRRRKRPAPPLPDEAEPKDGTR
jgi:hypothetical protein